MPFYYCPNCGASNPDSAATCYNCGAPNPTAQSTDATPPAVTNPFEAPTQPQSPYQAPSYPPPLTYGTPPTPYQQPAAYTPPDVTPAYGAPLYGQAGYPYPASSIEAQRLQGQARTALILGILGLLCCGLLGPVALAIGMQAKSGLQRMGVMEGQSMALVGMILGGAATVIWLLSMLIGFVSG
jgi:hypothetical protein